MREKVLRERFEAEFKISVGEPTGYGEGYWGKYPLFNYADSRKVLQALLKELGYEAEKTSDVIRLVKVKSEHRE